jgi:hypothetical protein
MSDFNTNRIKVSFTASSLEEAELVQLRLQKVNNKTYNFEGPVVFKNKFIFSWYADITREMDENGKPLMFRYEEAVE